MKMMNALGVVTTAILAGIGWGLYAKSIYLAGAVISTLMFAAWLSDHIMEKNK